MTDKKLVEKAEEVIEKFIDMLEVDVEKSVSVEVDSDDSKYVKVEIEGEDLGSLIGYKGRTLSSLQTIYAQVLSNQLGEIVNVMLDVNGYRAKRNEYLESLALRVAQEAKESGQNVELLPLSAYERRIIHMKLKEDPDVTTESTGEGRERHVVVIPGKNNLI